MRFLLKSTLALSAAIGVGLSGLATPALATPVFNPAQLGLPLDELGRPNTEILRQASEFANTLPQELREPLLAAVAFYEGQGKPGVQLPENAPIFTQFFWPSISGKCIGNASPATGTAIAVSGPARIPVPAPGPGDTTFVFTALGTAPTAGRQDMRVHWFNLDTLRGGSTDLGYHGINPDGPSTLSGRAHTEPGRVVALVEGTVHTRDAACQFFPTAAFFQV